MIGNVPLDLHLGSGITRLRWIEALRSEGFEVVVWEPKDYEWGEGRGWPAKKFRQTIGAWRKAVRDRVDHSFQAVLLYGDEFWMVSSWLRKCSPRPLLVAGSDGVEIFMMERLWAFEGEPWSLKQKIRRYWDRLTHYRLSIKAFRQVDALICGAKADIEEAVRRKYFSQEWTLINPPGLHRAFFGTREFSERNLSIAFNGSWIPRKGIGTFVRVTARLMKRLPALKIEIYGTGDASSENKIQNLYPEEQRTRVCLHPRHTAEQLKKGLERVSIFFLPTQYEGFGMATSEAMACGCAVVTTPTGFGAELESGKEAIVHDFEDEEGMEESLYRLLTDLEFQREISAKGRERIQGLRWEISQERFAQKIRQWIQIWNERSKIKCVG